MVSPPSVTGHGSAHWYRPHHLQRMVWGVHHDRVLPAPAGHCGRLDRREPDALVCPVSTPLSLRSGRIEHCSRLARGWSENLKLLACSEPCFSFQSSLQGCLSVASRERSFSKLKLIKNYLHSTMGQSRLSNLAIVSAESELAKCIYFDYVIHNFAAVNARKAKFGFSWNVN